LNSSLTTTVLETHPAIDKKMFFIFFIAILNLALGFALAMYLGGHYCMIRKLGVKIPRPLKSVPPMAGGKAVVLATESQSHPPAKQKTTPP
jgi:hypothetical protein